MKAGLQHQYRFSGSFIHGRPLLHRNRKRTADRAVARAR
jgi:hypothetical protein